MRAAGPAAERIPADAVVLNGDISALGTGLLGNCVARATKPTAPRDRSLSALTFNVVAQTGGFPLIRHSVFFLDQ